MAIRRISDTLGTPAAGTPGPPGTSAPAPAKAAAKAPSRALVPTQAPATLSDGTAVLATELNDVTQTLDLLATIVASVSDRVDGQTTALGKLTGTAAETRQAAFAARAQADPGKLAAEVGQALDKALLPRLRELAGAVERLDRAGGDRESLTQLRGQASDFARDLRHARERAALWRARLPGIGAATLLLVLALLVLTPRFMADHPATCRLMGGEWRDYTEWGDGTRCQFERL